jgi:hypothetical protein
MMRIGAMNAAKLRDILESTPRLYEMSVSLVTRDGGGLSIEIIDDTKEERELIDAILAFVGARRLTDADPTG